MQTTPLITAEELAEQLAAPGAPAVLDIRYRLLVGGPGPTGAQEYAAGHIPGAHHLDMDADLAAAPGPRGRHPLPDPAVLGAALRRAGVCADRPVVVYDDAAATSAARAWWLLRWAGHPRVRVLDGGLGAWRAAGLPLTTGTPAPEEGDFVPSPGGMPVLELDDVAGFARRGLLLDARAAERYRGESEPIDSRAGHIPGAVSAPTTGNVGADGRFRAAPELAERFRALGALDGGPVAAYCGSGVTAAHEVLALELVGVRAALYAGSWSEWCADPARPAATGALPG